MSVVTSRHGRVLVIQIARGDPTERGGLVGLIHRERTKPLIAAVEGLALAARVTANAPLAVRAALGIARTEVAPDEVAIWARSDAEHAALLETGDFREGIDAFFAHRAPHWTGN